MPLPHFLQLAATAAAAAAAAPMQMYTFVL